MPQSLDDLVNLSGLAGDEARERLTNPAMPLETPAMTRDRVQDTARQQQTVQRIRAADLAARDIPTYTDPDGNIEAVRGGDGIALNKLDKRNNLAWDATGNPVKLEYGESGPPLMVDPMATARDHTDKQGNKYKVADGLPWQWAGFDEGVKAEYDAAKELKEMMATASAMGGKMSLDAHDIRIGEKQKKTMKEQLLSRVPQLAEMEGADRNTVLGAIDAHYNTEAGFGGKDANDTTGWFGNGGLTPEAQARRAAIEAEKAQARDTAAKVFDLDDNLTQLKARHAAASSVRHGLATKVADAQLAKLGLTMPAVDNLSAAQPGMDAAGTPGAPDSGAPDAATEAQIVSAAGDSGAWGTIKDVANTLFRGATTRGLYAGYTGISRSLSELTKNVAPEFSDWMARFADQSTDTGAAIEGALPVSEPFNQSLVGKIVEGFGQMGGSALTYLNPAGVVLGPLHSFGQAYDEGWQDAMGKTGDPETAHQAAMKYLPAGALDVLGEKLILGRVLKPLKGKMSVGDLMKYIGVSALVAGPVEGATEGGQQLWLNTVAKYLQGYDPERPLDDGVIESVIVGAIVGKGSVAVGAIASNAMAQEATPETVQSQDPTDPTDPLGLGGGTQPTGDNGGGGGNGANPTEGQAAPAPTTFATQEEFDDFMDDAANRGDTEAAQAARRDNDPAWFADWFRIANQTDNDRARRFVNSTTNERTNAEHLAYEAEQAGLPAPTGNGATKDSGAAPTGNGEQAPASSVDVAAHDAATSPLNERNEPTDGQKKAGVYKMGHTRISGLPISIENPAGSVRRGKSADGTEWETPMTAHYGYIKRTEGKDGDQVDLFIKEGTPEDYEGPVYVVNQFDPKTRKMDEHKAILGVNSPEEARALYHAQYEQSWKGYGGMRGFASMDAFKAWLPNAKKARPRFNPDGTNTDTTGQVPSQQTGGALPPTQPPAEQSQPTTGASPRTPTNNLQGNPQPGSETRSSSDSKQNEAAKPANVAAGARVRASGAEYTVREVHPDGTYTLASESGEFQTNPGEAITVLDSAPRSQGSGATSGTRQEFIAKRVAETKSARARVLRDAESAINAAFTPKAKLPVGVSKLQAFLNLSRHSKEERALLARYNVAKRNFEADTRADEDTAGRVFDELQKRGATQPEPKQPGNAETLETAKRVARELAPDLKRIGVEVIDYGGTSKENASGAEFIDGKVRLDPRKLKSSMDAIRRQNQRDGNPSTPEDWLKAVLRHEALHVAQDKYAKSQGTTITKMYGDAPAEAFPADLMEFAGRAYGEEWAKIPAWAQRAEATRMVLEGRWTGTITEALQKIIRDLVSFIQRTTNLDGASDWLKQHVAEVERVAAGLQPEQAAPATDSGAVGSTPVVAQKPAKPTDNARRPAPVSDKPAPQTAEERRDALARSFFAEGLGAADPENNPEISALAERLKVRYDGRIEVPGIERHQFTIEDPESPAHLATFIVRGDVTEEALSARIAEKQEQFSGDAATLNAASPVTHKGFPKEKRAQALELADAMIETGITTPEATFTYLQKIIGEDRARSYAKAMWATLVSADPELPADADWSSIFEPKPTEPEAEAAAEPPVASEPEAEAEPEPEAPAEVAEIPSPLTQAEQSQYAHAFCHALTSAMVKVRPASELFVASVDGEIFHSAIRLPHSQVFVDADRAYLGRAAFDAAMSRMARAEAIVRTATEAEVYKMVPGDKSRSVAKAVNVAKRLARWAEDTVDAPANTESPAEPEKPKAPAAPAPKAETPAADPSRAPKTLIISGTKYPVKSLKEASEKAATIPPGKGAPLVMDQKGRLIGHIGEGGRVWPGGVKSWMPGTKALYDPARESAASESETLSDPAKNNEDTTTNEDATNTLDQRQDRAETGNPTADREAGAGRNQDRGDVGGKQPEPAPQSRGKRATPDGSEGGDQERDGGETTRGGSGGGKPATDRTRTVRDVRRPESDAPVEPSNYILSEPPVSGRWSHVERFNANVAAIRLLKQIEQEQRPATNAEKDVLVKYVGWGGLKNAFVADKADWQGRYQELKDLLTPEEYETAQATILDAHYTGTRYIDAIYSAFKRFGFAGGPMVEGGVGLGHFVGRMPAEWRANSSYLGVERDGITSRIASALYPKATILNKPFEEAVLNRGSFRASAGNPPFGQQRLYDKNFPEASKYSIHNFFIGKQLELLEPNGLAGYVVSHYFLDAKDPSARKFIHEQAEFLGAIRLPNNAFKENANTEVTTDIVFFRKRVAGEKPDGNAEWLTTVPMGDSVNVNRWMNEHPEMMLGTPSVSGTMYAGREEFTLEPIAGADIDQQLAEAVAKLPENVHNVVAEESKRLTAPPEKEPSSAIVPPLTKVGSYFTRNGKIYRRLPDSNEAQQVEEFTPESKAQKERIEGMSKIRGALNELIDAEVRDADGKKLKALRKRLNALYDGFVAKHKPLNTLANRRAFQQDTDAARVLALEKDFDPGVSKEVAKKKGLQHREPSAKKAAIFSARVNLPWAEVTRVNTPADALTVSLNQRGKVDVPYMAKLANTTEEKVKEALSGLIFQNPVDQGWEISAQYLAGDVRTKLNEAKEAAKNDPSYKANVEALEKALPKDIPAGDIRIPMGAGWIDAKYVRQFITELAGETPEVVEYAKGIARWNFKGGFNHGNLAVNQTYGTSRFPLGDVMDHLLNAKTIAIYDRIDDKQVFNAEATQAAQAKADEVRGKWEDWVFADSDRAAALHRKYNDEINRFAESRPNGSHLTLPGKSALINLRRNQTDGAWRIITERNVLLDHVVGAGKTYTVVAGVMEMKRMGLARKQMLVVPNHLVGQWRDAFTDLYPNANVLYATPKDFEKKNRPQLFARIMTGEYDAVIIGHSSLIRIGLPAGEEAAILKEMLDEVTEAITQMRLAERSAKGKSGSDSRFLAGLERTKQTLEAKFKKASDRGPEKERAISFDELGIDGLYVDEAHEFKNLFFTTSMTRVAGLGDPQGSAKAFDLFVKTRYLRARYSGRAPIVFATGTPVSNSLVELFTVMRFLVPQTLERMGIKTLDAWTRVFGDVKSVYEVDPSGTGYRLATRYAGFLNVGELSALYRTFGDVITMGDLQSHAESEGKKFPVPKVKGGKPQNVVVERTQEQAEYFGIPKPQFQENGDPVLDGDGNPVVEYKPGSILHRIQNMPDDPSEDNMLKITNDARKSSLDMRLIHPDLPDNPNSKPNKAVAEIVRVHKEWAAKRGAQLVFCDLSTPASARGKATAKAKETATAEGVEEKPVDEADELKPQEAEEGVSMDELLADQSKFSVYDDMREKLVRAGVKPQEIAFIHDYDTPDKKQKLFKAVNAGEVRILFGSTKKMGAGMNVQKKLVALHHLDAPWKPSDLEQREGRIIRQGNSFYEADPEGFEVEVLRYATRQTYDTRMWQLIEHKAAGIEQYRRADASVRELEDVSGEAANAADMKAEASGDPLIQKENELRGQLKKLELLRRSYTNNKSTLEAEARQLAARPENYAKMIAEKRKVLDFAKANPKPEKFEAIRPDGTKFTERDQLNTLVIEAATNAKASRNGSAHMATYRGAEIWVHYRPGSRRVDVHLAIPSLREDFEVTYYGEDDKFSPTGFTQRIDNALEQRPAESIEWLEEQVKESEERLPKVREILKQGFSKQEDLDQVRKEHSEVQSLLRSKNTRKQTDADEGPTLHAANPMQNGGIIHRSIDGVWDRLYKGGRWFWEGTADVMRRNGFTELADSFWKQQDEAAKAFGQGWKPMREVLDSLSTRDQTQAKREFALYFRHKESKRPADAEAILKAASEGGKKLIAAWKTTALETGRILKAMDVHVKDGDRWRPIGQLGENFFPRKINREVMEVLNDVGKNPAKWKQLVQDLIDNKNIQDPSEADKFLNDHVFRKESDSDEFGNIERARAVKLPESWLEYEFNEIAPWYVTSYSRRIGQIAAYGQQWRPGGDLFDQVLETVPGAPEYNYTRQYIESARDAAYFTRANTAPAMLMKNLQAVATGTFLSNPFSAIRNLVSGTSQNLVTFGLGDMIAASYEAMTSAAARMTPHDIGVLRQDFFALFMEGRDDLTLKQGIRKAANAGLKWTGFNAAEDVVRTTAVLAALRIARRASKAILKNPDSRESLQLRAFLQRFDADPLRIATEEGKGPETEKFVRRAVNDTQGSYTFAQTPLIQSDPYIGFLTQFQKWGTQATRFLVYHTINPAIHGTPVKVKGPKGTVTTVNVRSFRPLLYAMAFAIGGGELLYWLKEVMQGRMRLEASLGEIEKAPEKLGLVLNRIVSDVIMAGTLGVLGDYGANFKEFASRGRFKNPFDPPGIQAFKNVFDGARIGMQQKTLTFRDLADLFGKQLPGIGFTEKAVRTLIDDPEQQAYSTRSTTRAAGRRMAEETGMPVRASFGNNDPIRTENSPFNNALETAVLSGNVAKARQLVSERLAGKNPDQRKKLVTAMKAVVSANQPITVGGIASAENRSLFLAWMPKRLPAEQVKAIRELDARYWRTAAAAGLVDGPPTPKGNSSPRDNPLMMTGF